MDLTLDSGLEVCDLFLVTLQGALVEDGLVGLPFLGIVSIPIHIIKLLLRLSNQFKLGCFNLSRIKVGPSVIELNDFLFVVSHASVVTNHDIFHAFNQPTLNVSGLTGFDRCINQTHSTTHCMEEELFRCKALDKGTLDEAAGDRRVIKLLKVWKGSIGITIGNTLAVHVLLAQTRNHLGNIEHRSFRPRLDNVDKPILFVQSVNRNFTRLRTGLVQDIVDFILKVMAIGSTRLVLQYTQVSLRNERGHLFFLLHDDFANQCIGLFV